MSLAPSLVIVIVSTPLLRVSMSIVVVKDTSTKFVVYPAVIFTFRNICPLTSNFVFQELPTT